MGRLLIACLLVPALAGAVDVKKEFNAKGLKTLLLENDSGDTKVVAGVGKTAVVEAEKVQFGKRCKLKMKRKGDVLRVISEKKGLWKKGKCKVNFLIQVPKKIALNLQTGSGDVQVEGTKGEVEIKSGSGDIKVDAVVKEFEGRAGSGSVKVNGLVGDAEVKVGSGNVSLTYKRVPKEGEVEVKTGSGNVTVFLPAGTQVQTDLKSGSGRVINEVGDSDGARFKLVMRSGSGKLRVKKRR